MRQFLATFLLLFLYEFGDSQVETKNL